MMKIGTPKGFGDMGMYLIMGVLSVYLADSGSFKGGLQLAKCPFVRQYSN